MSKPRSSGFTPAQERELRLAGYENPERKLQPPRGAGRPRPDGERVRQGEEGVEGRLRAVRH
jgi:hypothetical protein